MHSSAFQPLIFAYIIIAVSQIQRRLVLHVSQHFVGAILTEDGGDGGVLSPHRKMQGCAAIKHCSVHIGSAAEQQLHRCDVMQLHGEVKRRFATGSFLRGERTEKSDEKFHKKGQKLILQCKQFHSFLFAILEISKKKGQSKFKLE